MISSWFKDANWKFWMLVAGAIVLGLSTYYSRYISNKLIEGEEDKIELIAKTLIDFFEKGNDDDHTAHLFVFEENKSIPVLLVDENGEIIYANNYDVELESNPAFFENELLHIKNNGRSPDTIKALIGLDANGEKEFMNQYLYYKNSFVLRLLTWFPFLQLLLIGSFILVGYWGVSSARRAEQNRVWAGLAKETAHQLGTPISAIIAWIELLGTSLKPNDENQQILTEMEKDVKRLNLIADRFSKVGSKPQLEEKNLKTVLIHSVDYMKIRASRHVKFVFDENKIPDISAKINPPLFEWVIENLLRNALDAMNGKGNIVIDLTMDNKTIYLDISDTGKGIVPKQFKRVFDPGYSTKKRGWGLGLSLAKRIIEMYHKGKIYVKESELNVGSTFTIELPRLKQKN